MLERWCFLSSCSFTSVSLRCQAVFRIIKKLWVLATHVDLLEWRVNILYFSALYFMWETFLMEHLHGGLRLCLPLKITGWSLNYKPDDNDLYRCLSGTKYKQNLNLPFTQSCSFIVICKLGCIMIPCSHIRCIRPLQKLLVKIQVSQHLSFHNIQGYILSTLHNVVLASVFIQTWKEDELYVCLSFVFNITVICPTELCFFDHTNRQNRPTHTLTTCHGPLSWVCCAWMLLCLYVTLRFLFFAFFMFSSLSTCRTHSVTHRKNCQGRWQSILCHIHPPVSLLLSNNNCHCNHLMHFSFPSKSTFSVGNGERCSSDI